MIVDANVVVYWITDSPYHAAAERYLGRQDLVAPALLRLEVVSALLSELRRGTIGQEQMTAGLQLAEAAISHFTDDGDLLPRALDIAIRHNHKIYDCLYLALATERREPIATADRRLATIAQALFIETNLIEPDH